MSHFKNQVIHIVRLVPYGKVVSYGQVAFLAGKPRAARQVGWILNHSEGRDEMPWWRVVNNAGRISIKGSQFGAEMQRKLLVAEGVDVSDDLTFDIEVYRWKPN